MIVVFGNSSARDVQTGEPLDGDRETEILIPDTEENPVIQALTAAKMHLQILTRPTWIESDRVDLAEALRTYYQVGSIYDED